MKWEKIGLVYKPDAANEWGRSGAMLPTPVLLGNGIIRVYCSVCDGLGRARPIFVDLLENDISKAVNVSKEPLLDLGSTGTFDDNGILCTSVINVKDGVYYMYYVGFELYQKVRYKLFTGLAISEDGGDSFAKYSPTPVLDRGRDEYCFRGGPVVLMEDGIFKMWYVAGSNWENIAGKEMPVYVLRYIESDDGINWPNSGRVVLPITQEDEHGFGRPWITRENEFYNLYYSIRKRSLRAYRLGYATSGDGLNWHRKDGEMGLGVSGSGFDSEAVMYSAVITAGDGNTYCFYNGNGFGRDGFAAAIRKDS
jgi:hypothetical protein